jgi:hypothetical protein
MPETAGMGVKNFSRASRPPADAPNAAIRKCFEVDLLSWVGHCPDAATSIAADRIRICSVAGDDFIFFDMVKISAHVPGL